MAGLSVICLAGIWGSLVRSMVDLLPACCAGRVAAGCQHLDLDRIEGWRFLSHMYSSVRYHILPQGCLGLSVPYPHIDVARYQVEEVVQEKASLHCLVVEQSLRYFIYFWRAMLGLLGLNVKVHHLFLLASGVTLYLSSREALIVSEVDAGSWSLLKSYPKRRLPVGHVTVLSTVTARVSLATYVLLELGDV